MNINLGKFIALIIFFLCTFFYKFCCVRTPHITPPTFRINLDLDPEQRWNEIIDALPQSLLLQFIHIVKEVLKRANPKIEPYRTALIQSSLLPDEYKKELMGISQALEKKLGTSSQALCYENLVLMNLTYELFTCCTSGIIVGEHNVPYLFRNLDWPIPFLKKCTINIDWYKNNKCLFRTTGFPFSVGIYTGERDNSFALSINSRHVIGGSIEQNIQDYLARPTDVWSISILTRHILQYTKDYKDAYKQLKHTKIFAPAFIALAGTRENEGIILARDRNKVVLEDSLKKWIRYYPEKNKHTNPANQRSPLIIGAEYAATKYIIITNIDPDYSSHHHTEPICKTGCCTNPLQVDKKIGSIGPQYRRNTALNSCCSLPNNFTVTDLFAKVLWIEPNLNWQTIYSTVMCPAQKLLQSFTY